MSDVPGTAGTARLIAGRYRLLSPLDEDGGGTLWLSHDEVLRREVAVKQVRAPASLAAGDVRRLYTHLENAARAAGRVSHRNAVAVHDVVTEDGRPWIVSELVRGLTLADVLDAEGPLPPRRAAHVGAEVLAALRAAHAAGVLHRDVNPSKVLMANDGRVMVTDFGTVAEHDSPEFGAPETVAGRDPGPESDLWSLGALLHAAVEGRSRFGAATDASTAPGSPERPAPAAADALGSVITGLLHRNPADRLDAAEAEHQLRLVSAGGGGVRTDGTPAASAPRTAPDTVAEPDSAPPPDTTSRPVAPAATGAAGPSDASRRATTVLAVGVALLLLCVVALVWAVAGSA
ncbi:serine/threonine-protein kinase [Streptomyces peucetius]|uniref:non-specific serine/threonine protein kinase n=1 Tax=Streptomyces peucetius TaxID=1950 RepID=A0ABY6I5N0_STRPE|nr:serine/threonine-protein kinase [Streptomyces peucetius]UYQ61297.1 serine/threonine protein kinase [Streptomyces peucetius]